MPSPFSSSTSLLLLGVGTVLGSCLTLSLLTLRRNYRLGRIVQLKQQFAADSAAHDALSAEATDAHSSGSGGRSVAKSLETSSLQFHSTRLLASEDFLHDEIINEQFTRNLQFFGEDGLLKVHQSFVVVVGLGGVGSHAAAMLLRSGVGKLRLVDFDQV
jgi:hypothetical protein